MPRFTGASGAVSPRCSAARNSLAARPSGGRRRASPELARTAARGVALLPHAAQAAAPIVAAAPMTDPLPWLRRTSIVEAISYLVLLGVAMPLKYVWGEPMAVRVFGMAHGVLFLLLVWLLVLAHMDAGWPLRRVLLVFAASLVPIWPFLLDRRLRAWIAATPR